MHAPLDSVASADWFVYHDWCEDMLAKGQYPPRPPFLIRQVAEVLRWYEERHEEPKLFLPVGSGWLRWSTRPSLVHDMAWADEITEELKDSPGHEPVTATNPQRRPWLKKNHPDCCWEFFGCLLYLAVSGKRA